MNMSINAAYDEVYTEGKTQDIDQASTIIYETVH